MQEDYPTIHSSFMNEGGVHQGMLNSGTNSLEVGENYDTQKNPPK